MNNINELYNRWLASRIWTTPSKRSSSPSRATPDAVTDRFYRDLEFGTGGLAA